MWTLWSFDRVTRSQIIVGHWARMCRQPPLIPCQNENLVRSRERFEDGVGLNGPVLDYIGGSNLKPVGVKWSSSSSLYTGPSLVPRYKRRLVRGLEEVRRRQWILKERGDKGVQEVVELAGLNQYSLIPIKVWVPIGFQTEPQTLIWYQSGSIMTSPKLAAVSFSFSISYLINRVVSLNIV